MEIKNLKIDQQLNAFKENCKTSGIKCTNQRIEVFKELIQSSNHPDAETVFQRVRKRLPNISLDTVYRTLWLLKDLGLITTLGPPRERTHFDADLSQHQHFICSLCGSVSDVHSKELNAFNFSAYVKDIGEAKKLQVTIHGICLECTNSEPIKTRI